MKSKPHGIERINEFLNKSFIAIGWPGIGNLTNVDKYEIKTRLQEKYHYQGQQLATYLGAVNAFVNTMKKGDIVLISNNLGQVFIFEVDDYKYVEKYDNELDGLCHQRDVELLAIVNKSDLSQELQDLLRNRGTITQFKYSYEVSGLDRFINKSYRVDLERLTDKALKILEKELDSTDPIIRIRAAGEILRYAKSGN